jgi:hypothetical protein
VAIGGVDAHARKYPLLPFVVFPYEYLFRTLRTHILTETELPEDAPAAIEAILGALQEGHCFTSYDYLHPGSGTRFCSIDGELMMGDETSFVTPVDFSVSLPREAHLSIIKNGVAIRRTVEKELVFTADTPGVYRIEARLDEKPWIYTNPIYLRPEA